MFTSGRLIPHAPVEGGVNCPHLSGSGTARVGELKFDLQAHDFMFVAAGATQGMINQSDTESLELLSFGARLLQSE